MELTGLGGGVMLALAAGLWLVYLVPTWLKRREYLATERNAVRLQQTIRVLAETSEVPKQLRAPAGPVAVGRAPEIQAQPDPQLLAARRLRRTRALASFVLVATVIAGIAAVVGGAWLLVAASALAAICSLALLGRLAEVSRARRAPATATRRTAPAFTDHAPVAQRREQAPWTPVAVPKPLYLSRSEAPARASRVEPGPTAAGSDESQSDLAAVRLGSETSRSINSEELERAAAAAQRALRDAEQPPAVVPARPAATSRFASMGIVDDADTSAPDIDAVLARRRAAAS